MADPASLIPTSSLEIGGIVVALQNIAAELHYQPFWNTQWFAAVVGAAIGLVPSFYLLFKDRPSIKVEIGYSLFKQTKIRSGIWVKISNSGRRPITITSIFLEFDDGETLVFLDNSLFVGGSDLPKIIDEGGAHTVTIRAGEIAFEINKKGKYPALACYRSATGRVYKCKMSKKFWDTFFKVSESKIA